jgi:hypothetical protein
MRAALALLALGLAGCHEKPKAPGSVFIKVPFLDGKANESVPGTTEIVVCRGGKPQRLTDCVRGTLKWDKDSGFVFVAEIQQLPPFYYRIQYLNRNGVVLASGDVIHEDGKP